MKAKFAVKNGEVIPAEKAGVSVFNKALFFNYAVYSNVKVVRNRMFVPQLAAQKLFESADALGLKHPFLEKQVVEWAKKLVDAEKPGDALIRMLLIGAASPGEKPELFLFPVGLTFHPDRLYSQGAGLVSVKGERYLPAVKSKDLLRSFQAYAKAQEAGAIDALLIDGGGNAREGTRTSFFAIRGSELAMAPKGKVLDGVTRKIVREIAPECGLDAVERDIPLADVLGKKFGEIFVSNASMGVMPVSRMDSAGYAVGGKTRALMKAFREYCGRPERWV